MEERIIKLDQLKRACLMMVHTVNKKSIIIGKSNLLLYR